MAFVNEKLTAEQRTEFEHRKIKKPTSDYFVRPIYRTVDAENNMCLWHMGNLGRDDFNDHEFLFEWNGNEYFVIMEYSDPNPDSNAIRWSISKYEKHFNGTEPFAADFKSALITYAVNGNSNQRGGIVVEVNFKR